MDMTEATDANIVQTNGNEAPHDIVTTEEPELCQIFFISFEEDLRPFRPPTYAEVAFAAMRLFNERITVHEKKRGGVTTYRIELPTPVPRQQALQFNVDGVQHTIPLNPIKPSNNFTGGNGGKRGTLLTLHELGLQHFKPIKNEDIDAMFQSIKLEVIKPTCYQDDNETGAPNGNRYLVVDTPENIARIPENIPVVIPNTNK